MIILEKENLTKNKDAPKAELKKEKLKIEKK